MAAQGRLLISGIVSALHARVRTPRGPRIVDIVTCLKILLFIALLFAPSMFLRADDDPGEVEPCTFVAHTPVWHA
jgi:hypothetical protein